jgi:hypothetical protein
VRSHPIRKRRAIASTLGLALLALCCGPALPEHEVVQALDGREYRVLALHEVPWRGETRLLRLDYETGAFDDLDATRREARALLFPLQNHLTRRSHVMIVANRERSDPWSDHREQRALLFERERGTWKIVAEDAPALVQSRLE